MSSPLLLSRQPEQERRAETIVQRHSSLSNSTPSPSQQQHHHHHHHHYGFWGTLRRDITSFTTFVLTLLIASLTLVAILAWNSAFDTWFSRLRPDDSDTPKMRLLYAVAVTLIASGLILVFAWFMRSSNPFKEADEDVV